MTFLNSFNFGILIVFNDLIWWLPFGAILLMVYNSERKGL